MILLHSQSDEFVNPNAAEKFSVVRDRDFESRHETSPEERWELLMLTATHEIRLAAVTDHNAEAIMLRTRKRLINVLSMGESCTVHMETLLSHAKRDARGLPLEKRNDESNADERRENPSDAPDERA